MGTSWEHAVYHGVMKNSYLVEDKYEVTGYLLFYYKYVVNLNGSHTYHTGEEEYWLLGLDLTDDNVHSNDIDLSSAISVNHVKGKDIEKVTIDGQSLKSGTKITIRGKYYGYAMEDIELLFVNGKKVK